MKVSFNMTTDDLSTILQVLKYMKSIESNSVKIEFNTHDLLKKILINPNIDDETIQLIIDNTNMSNYTFLLTALLQNVKSDFFNINIANLIIEKVFNVAGEDSEDLEDIEDVLIPESSKDGDDTITLYLKTQNQNILNVILENIAYFFPTPQLMDIVVKHIDRKTYAKKIMKRWDNNNKQKVSEKLKLYDDAVKRRIADISFGLGYAQMDNQVQSTIPSLVLQEIANQSVDLSGMPAWQVYQIVKHINEGVTDKTVRLGQPSNFADAEDVIEI